ncbi:MAG TPA: hypothetical protein VFZ97_08620 [Acidimicrobiales bacterium]
MTSILRPVVSVYRLAATTFMAAIIISITLAVLLNFETPNATASRSGHADPTLCAAFANATAGSPASFRLADEISAHGGC